MGCFVSGIGVVVPRVLMVAWWLVDAARWASIFDSVLIPAVGLVFLPWTVLWYVVFQPQGFGPLSLLVLVLALLADLGTWGIGAFAARKQVSYYRDA